MSTSPTDLARGEAVDLGHAWVQHLADSRGVRVIFIKGPALHRYKLRNPRQSTDIDVLAEPAAFEDLCHAFIEAGWRERPSTFIGSRTSVHSRTFIHDDWPCDVDMHAFYPGFLAPPATVFEALWRDRVAMDFAHRDCAVPSRLASALILALHSLRGTTTQARHQQELDQLLTLDLNSEERAALASLARKTGCAATLEPVLTRLRVNVPIPDHERTTTAAIRWQQRVASGSNGAYFWIDAFRRGDARERLAIARHAVWPTRAELLLARQDVADTPFGLAKGRLERWGRGIRSLPQALRAIGKHR